MSDSIDIRSPEVVIEKMDRNWEEVMSETRGAWKSHPALWT
jgi:hypothetical protein